LTKNTTFHLPEPSAKIWTSQRQKSYLVKTLNFKNSEEAIFHFMVLCNRQRLRLTEQQGNF